MAQFRETPYSVFNYLVDLGDGTEGDIAGGFSEVSNLNAEVTIAEYRRGNAPTNYCTKVPAINKAGDVTLKRGVVGASNINSWLDEVRAGVISKKDVTIKLKSEDPTSDTAVVTWKLKKAMPIKWTGPTLTAKGGSDVAIEELVLSVEYIEQE
ncbi:phage tail protein [Marinibactrum halimedae]|uniref:Phage tail protein n=1 Tax=Marinibactrum halimedae TaxID=1444977 RepID=A0AA37T5S2_9GAMM|nr:phage tail protein [Marinibactrum halimedae]MCD9460632.1 phage tail protein [Marinibactrum halimedae]GLS27848.1 phage tail protein [Marinibactrum halimedae]